MGSPKSDTVRLIVMARELRRKGWGYTSIKKRLIQVEKDWNDGRQDQDYRDHHVVVTRKKIQRWVRDVEREHVMLDDLIAQGW